MPGTSEVYRRSNGATTLGSMLLLDLAGDAAHAHRMPITYLCVPRTSSMSRDQAVFADHATDASLPSGDCNFNGSVAFSVVTACQAMPWFVSSGMVGGV